MTGLAQPRALTIAMSDTPCMQLRMLGPLQPSFDMSGGPMAAKHAGHAVGNSAYRRQAASPECLELRSRSGSPSWPPSCLEGASCHQSAA